MELDPRQHDGQQPASSGYTYAGREPRVALRATLFPFVDILEGGTVYTSFGFEPFTPNNELRYKTFQVQDNFTKFSAKHTLTVRRQRREATTRRTCSSRGKQSVYVYNSLADFYTDANDYLANPNRTVSPVSLRRFQVRYNNIPGQEKPIQPLRGRSTAAPTRRTSGACGRQLKLNARPPARRAVLRRHGLRQRRRPTR